MGKKTKLTKKQKQHHYFFFKGNKGTHYKSKIQVDFSPNDMISVIPKFNKDYCHYTPAFVVPSLYSESKVDYQAEHNNKVKATDQKQQQDIFVPKPRPSRSYCGVCSCQYKDYLQHVESMLHKTTLKYSDYYYLILELCYDKEKQNRQQKSQHLASVNSKISIATQAHEQQQTISKETRGRNQNQFHQNQIPLA